jgi:hypothetical protein
MLTLLRVLIVWVLAALLARPILVGVRTGQLRYRQGLIVKKQRQPLAFWAIAAVNLFFALAFFAIGAGILSGRI